MRAAGNGERVKRRPFLGVAVFVIALGHQHLLGYRIDLGAAPPFFPSIP